MTPPSTERSACMWCGGAPLSREHLLPQWVTKVLAELSPSSDGYDFAYEGTTAAGAGIPRAYRQLRPEVVVNAVCQQCNSGWMAVLEETTRPVLEPLIRGNTAHLDLAAQSLLARWFAKIAVLLEHYMPESIILSPGDISAIYQGGSAPAGFHISLAHRNEERPAPFDIYVSSVFAASPGLVSEPSEVAPNAFSVTIGLGQVAIAVVGGPGVNNPDRWATGGNFPLMVWPPTARGISWPPAEPKVSSREELRLFHERFWARFTNPQFPRPDAFRHVGRQSSGDE